MPLSDNKEPPFKYSVWKCDAQAKLLVAQIRKSMNIPAHVHDDMINRQLAYCKERNMSIEEAKAHLLNTYGADIRGEVEQDVIDLNKKVMEGYRPNAKTD